ncbi:MAG: HlyC/CorC family transporter [Pirellulales bacterium]|nr:HlyC/CorC family transporter [Pirellulales bacterium]
MWLFLLAVVGALLISALCSLMEATLLSLKPSQLAEVSSRWPRIGAVWRRFQAEMDRPIAAILVLNTAAHTIGASVAGAKFNALFGADWIWVFSLVFTLLMLQFTEIVPKSAGVRFNRQVAVWIARPLTLLVHGLLPVTYLIHWINRPLFGGKRPPGEPAATLEEITALASLARLSKQISPRQEQIIEEGARLSRRKVRAVMRSRVDIDALDIDTPPREVVGAVVMSGFSRVPVYKGNLDHIVGFVYIKDVLRQVHMGWPIELSRLLRPAPFIPGTLSLDRLLQMFRKERTQMAIILDEYGGTVGLVTMEDVLEELVGEIYDEHRRDEEPPMARRDETSWRVGGTASLRDLLEVVGLPELRSDIPRHVNTVGGLIQRLLGQIPDVGDHATWNGLLLEVIEMKGVRIDRVLVRVQEKPSASDRRSRLLPEEVDSPGKPEEEQQKADE